MYTLQLYCYIFSNKCQMTLSLLLSLLRIAYKFI
uniref:Uncharacterized protein n=1 Tax=Siphoviridae sp. cttFh17 TaxID=2826491 RepID=A0A8S5NI93_9CAUD|nr:MAG TPA: hypothetical protein [Siphoviridae sp. cttFh17]